MDPILVDPGKFYLNIMLVLFNAGFDNSDVGCITTLAMMAFDKSLCSDEDRPKDFIKFVEEANEYASEQIGKR